MRAEGLALPGFPTRPLHPTRELMMRTLDLPPHTSRAQGRFPKPVSISDRSVGWVEAEVDAWLEARIAQRDMEAA
jgi:hypothetical protein